MMTRFKDDWLLNVDLLQLHETRIQMNPCLNYPGVSKKMLEYVRIDWIHDCILRMDFSKLDLR